MIDRVAATAAILRSTGEIDRKEFRRRMREQGYEPYPGGWLRILSESNGRPIRCYFDDNTRFLTGFWKPGLVGEWYLVSDPPELADLEPEGTA